MPHDMHAKWTWTEPSAIATYIRQPLNEASCKYDLVDAIRICSRVTISKLQWPQTDSGDSFLVYTKLHVHCN